MPKAAKKAQIIAPTGPRYVVGLGASAGGLEALERFFDKAPCDSGAAFVVVMHLARDFKSVLDELLARHTRMPVRPVQDGSPLEADTVYVIQPATEIEVVGNVFRVAGRPASTTSGRISSIDILLHSIANSWQEKGAAVILSGSGSDGAHGAIAIHSGGGVVCAQSPETAKFDSMPIAAIATNCVSGVDAPEALAQMVLEGISLPRVSLSNRQSTNEETALQEILSCVVGASHLDASQYTRSTFERRVQRRLRELQVHSLVDYAALVRGDRNEARALSETLLIGVTDFFRDESAFSSIERLIAPDLLRRAHAEKRPIRIWVAGCASGEEAYSLAMLFAEASADFPTNVEVQIFATDVHKGLLAEAARGEYPSERMHGVSDARKRLFFSRTPSGNWQIDAKIRKSIVFAPHDVLSDPPFTRLDLVSCRNLLIYFSVEAQQRVIGSFAFGLLEKGYLFLGSSETVGAQRDSFEFVDVRRRVFRRTRSQSKSPTLTRAVESFDRLGIQATIPTRRSAKLREAVLLPAYSAMLNEFAPPSLLVSAERELQHTFGNARQYLRTPEGVARLDVTEMVDPALRTPLTAGIDRALLDKAAITFSRIQLNTVPEKGRIVDVTVKPLLSENGDAAFALVMLQEVDHKSPALVETPVMTSDNLAETRIAELEIEVLRTREALQSTIEEIETANEELQATNEELMSSNEELQSTNEELSSLNEELHSVNAEHFRQNDELVRLTRDFDALLHATEIGVLFFDEVLNIRRFTRLIAELFHFTETDIGRPLRTFRSPFQQFDIEDFLHRVMRVGLIEEIEALDYKGRAWLLRAAGYPDQKGVVLSIISITRLREATVSPTDVHDRLLARAAPFVGDPILVVAPASGRVEYANSAALARLGVPESGSELVLQVSRLTPEWGDATWISWLSTIAPGTENTRLDVAVFDRKGSIFLADLRATLVSDPLGKHAVVRVLENQERAAAVRELQERSRMFALSNRELEQFSSIVAHDLRAPLRHLNQFAGFLQAELGNAATETVQEYLQIIQSSAANMSGMIERMLDYARIGAGAPTFTRTSLASCVEEAAEMLRVELQASGANLKFSALPAIDGDRVLLVRLFQNLISNSLKYRSPGMSPEITISSKPAGPNVLILFADNGIGIAPSHAEDIFKMFSRLHSDAEYSGHGMGLSICRKVCEIHDGAIDLDKSVQSGARFIIRLPRPQAAAKSKPATKGAKK